MDLKCQYDFDMFATELDDPMAELAQDVLHILLEPLGTNIDDPTRGLGFPDRLSQPFDPRLPTEVEQQLMKDIRITAARCEITQLDDTSFTADIQIEANGDELGIVFNSDGTFVRVT